jgi:hypothetical protein
MLPPRGIEPHISIWDLKAATVPDHKVIVDRSAFLKLKTPNNAHLLAVRLSPIPLLQLVDKLL